MRCALSLPIIHLTLLLHICLICTQACLSCARHTIPQVLCDVVSTLSLSRSAGAASVSARLDEGLALVHDMLLFHSVVSVYCCEPEEE